MGRRTTLKDVATAAGVSIAAVSMVLNNRPTRVSQEKRRLIFETAQRLNYVPDQNARGLVTSRSMLLALLVPDIENMFFASLAKNIEDRCHADGYSLIVANSDDSRDNEGELLTQLDSRNIDGLFFIPARESAGFPEEVRRNVERVSCPVVLTDRLADAAWCDSVGSDNIAGGRLAAKLLIEAGHARIACVSGDGAAGSSNDRRAGFVDELAKAGLALDPQLDLQGDYRYEGGYQAAERLAESIARGDTTAIFCCNDLMAMGVMSRLRELGLHTPEDYSLIGYDNIMSRFGIASTLTTIDQDIAALADVCHRHMMAYTEQSGRSGGSGDKPWLSSPEHTLIQPKIVCRATVRMR